MQAQPRNVNVVLCVWLLGPFVYQPFQLTECLLEIGHLQASRVPDRKRDAFFRDQTCRLRDRLALARRGQPALKDAIDERALTDPCAASYEHVDLAKVAQSFFERFVNRCR